MNESRKKVKEYLIGSTRTEFYAIIEEAKLTPRQRLFAIERIDKNKFNYLIAMENNISPETVKKELGKVYDKCGKVINKEV